MADPRHLEILNLAAKGVEAIEARKSWNDWRLFHHDTRPDLSGADLSERLLIGVNFSRTNLRGANLSGASLITSDFRDADLAGTNFSNAKLQGAIFSGTDLSDANLSGAELQGCAFDHANLMGRDLSGAPLTSANLIEANLKLANLTAADLSLAHLNHADLSYAQLINADLGMASLTRANLTGADLTGADLSYASLVEAKLTQAILSGCRIFGISAWGVVLDDVTQRHLVITKPDEPTVTVDDVEVAQFLYLMLNNQKIRHVVDTVASKVVLILGRFTADRKLVLDALREALRNRDYAPVLFDFDKPGSRDIHETVTTLARLARFVIADITDPRSIPQELVSIVEQLPSLPVQPLLQRGNEPWGMFDHIAKYPWVLALYYYDNLPDLLRSLEEKVIGPAEAKAQQLQRVLAPI